MELHRSSVSKDGLGPPRCANALSVGIPTNRFEPPCLACWTVSHKSPFGDGRQIGAM